MPQLGGEIVQIGTDKYKLVRGADIDITMGNSEVTSVADDALFLLDEPKTIVFSDYDGEVAGTIKAECTAHGLYTGLRVTIESTPNGNYNASNVLIFKIDDDNFYFSDTFSVDTAGFLYGTYNTTKYIKASNMNFGANISGVPVTNDYARFSDENTLEGRSYSELAGDIGSSINTIGTVTTGTLSTGAVLEDVTMTLGSDVDGDIYYRSSSKLTRLAKGTAGQALIMNSGATAPEWGAAGSSIDESNPILDSNSNELLEFQNIAAAVNHIKIDNAITTNSPLITVDGDDTDIDLALLSKGSAGVIKLYTNNKGVFIDAHGSTNAKNTTLDFNHTDNRTITFPDYTGEVVLKENLSIDDDISPLLGGNLQLGGNTIVQQSTDMITFTTNGNRHLSLDFDSQAEDSALVLTSSVTTSRVIGFPDSAGTLALTDQILIKSTTELETELANIDSDVTIGNGIKVITSGDLQVGNTSHSIISPIARDGDDLVGYRMNIQGGPSTGSGAGGAINLRTSPGDGGTASTVNNFDTILSISGDGHIGIKAASKLFLDGENANGATYIQESSDNVIKLVAGGADMLILDEGNSKISFGGVTKGTQIELAETSTPGNQTSGFGTFYINDGKPYFKNDDDEVKKLDIAFWDEQWSMRWYNKEDDWYTFSTSYGPNYYHWNKNLGNGLLGSWLDTYTPGIVIPRDVTLTGYNLKGRADYSNTYELKIAKATPSWGTDGSHTLSAIGSTQSKAITANVSDTIGETGLSVSLSEGDILVPQFRKTINPIGDTVTRYFYGVFSIQGDYA